MAGNEISVMRKSETPRGRTGFSAAATPAVSVGALWPGLTREADGRDHPMTAEQSRIERLTEQEGDAQQHRRYPALASVQHLPQYSTPRHHRPGP
jgi:hypothetical protein